MVHTILLLSVYSYLHKIIKGTIEKAYKCINISCKNHARGIMHGVFWDKYKEIQDNATSCSQKNYKTLINICLKIASLEQRQMAKNFNFFSLSESVFGLIYP